MTKKEREQVVELLRCAADEDPNGGPTGIMDTEDSFDFSTGAVAFDAYRSLVIATGFIAPSSAVTGDGETFRWHLLEAAQCVEEGSWP